MEIKHCPQGTGNDFPAEFEALTFGHTRNLSKQSAPLWHNLFAHMDRCLIQPLASGPSLSQSRSLSLSKWPRWPFYPPSSTHLSALSPFCQNAVITKQVTRFESPSKMSSLPQVTPRETLRRLFIQSDFLLNFFYHLFFIIIFTS